MRVDRKPLQFRSAVTTQVLHLTSLETNRGRVADIFALTLPAINPLLWSDQIEEQRCKFRIGIWQNEDMLDPMSEFFTPRIEGIKPGASSFDHHAHRMARYMRQAEEIAKRVELQRQAAVEPSTRSSSQQNSAGPAEPSERG